MQIMTKMIHHVIPISLIFQNEYHNCLGKPEREYEMILKRTLQSICVLTIHPNTITSVILQVSLLTSFSKEMLA